MVWWRPEVDPGLILLEPSPVPIGGALPPPSHARSQDGQLWWMQGEGQDRRRLALLAGGVDPAVARLAAVIPLDADLPARLEALARLWRELQGRQRSSDPITAQRRGRLKAMLRALDARLDGAAYREIAGALYGAARVAAEPWKTSSLRDATLRLVRDGRAMIAGGYQGLLR